MNLGATLAFSNEMFGTKVYPVTHLMMEAMDGSYNFLLVIIVGFCAGELVWRERTARISDVTVECALYQLIRGYHRIEPGLYVCSFGRAAAPSRALAGGRLCQRVSRHR